MAPEKAFITFLVVLLTVESGRCQLSTDALSPNSTANTTAFRKVTITASPQTFNTSVTSSVSITSLNGILSTTTTAGGTAGTTGMGRTTGTEGTAGTAGTGGTAGTLGTNHSGAATLSTQSTLGTTTVQPDQIGSNNNLTSSLPPYGPNSYSTTTNLSVVPSNPKPSPTTKVARSSVSTARSALPNSPTSDSKKTIWPVVAAILSIFAFFILLLVATYCLCCKDVKTVQFDHHRLYDESGEVVFRLDDLDEHRNPRFYDFSPTAYTYNMTPSYGSNLQPPPGSVST